MNRRSLEGGGLPALGGVDLFDSSEDLPDALAGIADAGGESELRLLNGRLRKKLLRSGARRSALAMIIPVDRRRHGASQGVQWRVLVFIRRFRIRSRAFSSVLFNAFRLTPS